MSIAPQQLNETVIPEIKPKIWQTYVKNELIEIRLQLAEYLPGTAAIPDKKAWATSIQQHLVMLSDQVNGYLFRERKIWSSHSLAPVIKAHYLYLLSELENLQNEMALRYPEYYDSTVKYTDYHIKEVLPRLRNKIDNLRTRLESSAVPEQLMQIVLKGLNDSLIASKLNKAIEEYITCLVGALSKSDHIDETVLLDLLTQYNFNMPELLLYQMDNIEETLVEIHGLHDQVEKLVQLKRPLVQNPNQGQQSLHPNQRSLKDEINTFYLQKITYLEELIAVKRKALQDKNEMEDLFRMATNLSVPQLGLFIRMLREKGVVVKKEANEVFSFFARYFYTDNALFISARNMLKKSTEVEFATALKLWDLLMEMLDWLDDLFSIRNYQRSL